MTSTYQWSVEEYHLMIESGLLTDKPVELLNGRVIEMSPEREEHSYTNDDVAELLREKLRGIAKIRESHPTDNRYSQIKEYTRATVSPLAFPQVEIALEQLLLF